MMIATSGVELERGDLEKATASSLSCAARSEELGAYACVVASNVMYGAASLALDNATAARGPLERGNELCMVTNMASMRTLIQSLLGSVRAQLGDLPGGVAGWEAALAGARSMSDRYGEAQTLWGRGRTMARGATPDWTAAVADLDRAIELFEAMEARPSLARALQDRAKALSALGRADEAADDDRSSRELARGLGLKDIQFA
jgi:tetratricopeptide (TPR) repeat protein